MGRSIPAPPEITTMADSTPPIGSTPAKAIQQAVETAKDSNKPIMTGTGDAKAVLAALPNRHPIPGLKPEGTNGTGS
jgi:hypothetical protein